MDEPLFGRVSRREVLVERFANAFIASISVATVAASLIRAVNTGILTHALLGLCVSLFAAIEIRLVNWYRVGDLEPNFKYVIFALALAILLLCITANMYFFLA